MAKYVRIQLKCTRCHSAWWVKQRKDKHTPKKGDYLIGQMCKNCGKMVKVKVIN